MGQRLLASRCCGIGGSVLLAASLALGCSTSTPATGPAAADSSPASTAAAPGEAATWSERWSAAKDDQLQEFDVDPEDFSVWIVEVQSGTSAGHRPDVAFPAASTIKLLVLAEALERAQDAGEPLAAETVALLEPMIAWSSNDATTALITQLGTDRFPAIGEQWGVPGARAAPWGLSSVSAREMARLVRAMFGGRLTTTYRSEAERTLDLVDPDFDTQ